MKPYLVLKIFLLGTEPPRKGFQFPKTLLISKKYYYDVGKV